MTLKIFELCILAAVIPLVLFAQVAQILMTLPLALKVKCLLRRFPRRQLSEIGSLSRCVTREGVSPKVIPA